MNEEIIISMVKPYVKDGAITYDEFDKIFSILSRKEQYAVSDILFKNGIDLVDEHTNSDALVLDVDTEYDPPDEFEILYDKDLFKDDAAINHSEVVFVNKKINQSNEILCYLIQQGNRQAVQDLCVKNQRLVSKYVIAYKKRYGNHLGAEDLEQVGFMGLIRAARKFDIGQGVSFSTYAVHWIKQAISREIMDHGYAIRIPVHMMERINKVLTIDNRLIAEGYSLLERITYIAKESGLSEDNVRDCLVLKNNYLSYASLDAPIGDDQDSFLGDFIPAEEDLSIEQIIFNRALRQELENVISTLKLKEQEIIKLRFGWDDNRPKTLEEIGTKYGITRERIRQIESKTLRRLRQNKSARRLKDFLEE